ncbi:M23 family metallopeptidase [Bartonella ancashensis]|uniref:Peptidase, M23/M37 family n=1 Tax=Bartonella ancashensis TaxID=1318743 RepID=A0A0M4L789_9HYPH|nr:M23 family metallopeptidase [Bartonella ancashensis]ALE03000.1 Peptidase, M23/M37 family [Bartonella ancashensis]
MWDNQHQNNDPGQEPALILEPSKPAFRQVSIRWLTGTVLTGVIACILMGIALFTALDEQYLLVTPAQWFNIANLSDKEMSDKGERIIPTLARQSFDSKRQFEVSVLQNQDDKKIVQTQNFEWIRMILAEERQSQYTYPKFDALSIFADDAQIQALTPAKGGHIYGAKTQTKMTLRNRAFSIRTEHINVNDVLTSDEVQQELQKADLFDHKKKYLPEFSFIDPLQLDNLPSSLKFSELPEVRIFQENVTVALQNHRIDLTKNYAEDIIPINKKQTIVEALEESEYAEDQIQQIVNTLAKLSNTDTLQAGSILRIGILTQKGEKDRLVRISIYQGINHILTVALNDENKFIVSTEPEMSHALKTAFQKGIPHSYVSAAQLPTVYDAIYRAVLSHNLPNTLAQHLVRLLATNIDMKSSITPTDQLEIFYATPEQDNTKNDGALSDSAHADKKIPEIRYVSATFGNVTYKYYRYQSADGSIDYYDSEGKSSKPFLLRKPVPNGVLGSPFGSRKHPILGYVRMHTGVDWVAPAGSPIIAVGDGVVTKIGTAGGYGNHIVIQHANGYVSSYAHQQGYAANIKLGTKVRQGQIIGYVGSTGLATGPHCHFEIVVNSVKVDPMRIRLPDSKTLTNKDLQTFLHEKNNIDSLIASPTT